MLMFRFLQAKARHVQYDDVDVWIPVCLKHARNTELLERVQHRFMHLTVLGNSLPNAIQWALSAWCTWSLQEQRNRADLIEHFKLVKGFSRTPWNEFFHNVREHCNQRSHMETVEESLSLRSPSSVLFTASHQPLEQFVPGRCGWNISKRFQKTSGEMKASELGTRWTRSLQV